MIFSKTQDIFDMDNTRYAVLFAQSGIQEDCIVQKCIKLSWHQRVLVWSAFLRRVRCPPQECLRLATRDGRSSGGSGS